MQHALGTQEKKAQHVWIFYDVNLFLFVFFQHTAVVLHMYVCSPLYFHSIRLLLLLILFGLALGNCVCAFCLLLLIFVVVFSLPFWFWWRLNCDWNRNWIDAARLSVPLPVALSLSLSLSLPPSLTLSLARSLFVFVPVSHPLCRRQRRRRRQRSLCMLPWMVMGAEGVGRDAGGWTWGRWLVSTSPSSIFNLNALSHTHTHQRTRTPTLTHKCSDVNLAKNFEMRKLRRLRCPRWRRGPFAHTHFFFANCLAFFFVQVRAKQQRSRAYSHHIHLVFFCFALQTYDLYLYHHLIVLYNFLYLQYIWNEIS